VIIKKLHVDEVDIDLRLVEILISSQFPEFSNLKIKPVAESGTDNVMFHLGNDLAIRLPRMADAESAIYKECKWLPKLAPLLPLDIPEPIAQGKAIKNYPFTWSICKWQRGENASLNKITDPHKMARDLANFISALQGIDIKGAPTPSHSFHRGVSLAVRDNFTRKSILELAEVIDSKKAMSLWEDALRLPEWQNPLVWIHGDLHYGNLLAYKGELSAVIDFGAMRCGDPACDLMTAWNLFNSEIRITFRDSLNIDEPTWLRGRAWALSVAVHTLPYYKDSNPFLANLSLYTINEVLSDFT